MATESHFELLQRLAVYANPWRMSKYSGLGSLLHEWKPGAVPAPDHRRPVHYPPLLQFDTGGYNLHDARTGPDRNPRKKQPLWAEFIQHGPGGDEDLPSP